MYYPALLILNNYVPLQVEEGMIFKSVMFPNTDKEFTILWVKKGIPVSDLDKFFSQHGYPVNPMVIDEDGETLAHPEQIGWWDEGDHTDDLRDITVIDMNRILKEHQGKIEIDISNEAYQINQIIPGIAEGKVILRIPIDEYTPDFDDMPDNEFNEED